MSEEENLSTDSPRIEEADQDSLMNQLKFIVIAALIIVIVGLGAAWFYNQAESARIASLDAAHEATTYSEWDDILSSYPDTPGALMAALDAAEQAKSEAQFSEAVTYYEKAYAMAPEGPFAHVAQLAIGTHSEAGGDLEKAAAIYEEIYAQRPDHPMLGAAVLGLARIYQKEGDVTAAREILAEFISNHSQIPGEPTNAFVAPVQQMMMTLPTPAPAEQIQESSSAK